MSLNTELLQERIEKWVANAPVLDDIDCATFDAQSALVEAGMVQFNEDGRNLKLHEKRPDAPKPKFKLMVREAPGVNTNQAYYDRFTLPLVMQANDLDCYKN